MSFVDLEPGDVVYSQYAVVDTIPIKSGQSIEKGHVYTTDTNGYLTGLTASNGNVSDLKRAYQAMADSAAVSGESSGDRKVQCLCKRSRILLKAPANAVPGDNVAPAASGSTVTADKIKVSATGKFGTIFEIYTLDGRSRKAKTANDDLVVVDVLE